MRTLKQGLLPALASEVNLGGCLFDMDKLSRGEGDKIKVEAGEKLGRVQGLT